MRWLFTLTIYRIVLPCLFVVAFPGWLIKMRKRGGFGTGLWQRAGCYGRNPVVGGRTHVHAVSVGEAMLALKLIKRWQQVSPGETFVLAVGTATGWQVANSEGVDGVQVVYAPLDLRWMVKNYFRRFAPSRVILVEGEVWPNLMLECQRRSVPVFLVNARMSPRSARRYRKFAGWLRPIFSLLNGVALQEEQDRGIWQALGVADARIVHTGSLKFDPMASEVAEEREEFRQILAGFGGNRPVVLAASTHVGEEAWLTERILRAFPQALPVMVPRHAERREEVRRELEALGHRVVLRSQWQQGASGDVLVVDSTGELKAWTASADVVVIGKSFLSTGGQNPVEAILAQKPVIVGPHMENFEPLTQQLVAAGAVIRADLEQGLEGALRECFEKSRVEIMVAEALRVISVHQGATDRILGLISPTNSL